MKGPADAYPFPTLAAPLRFAIALVAVSVVFVADTIWHAPLDTASQFLLLGTAVLASAWFAGTGPGLAATVLGAVLGAFDVGDASRSAAASGMKIAVLAGDGIGPEIVGEAAKVLDLFRREGLALETESAPIGGAGYDAAKHPLPEATLALARAADAVLLGAVGGPRYDTLPRALRPEQGILGIRKALGLFANLRPALLYPELASASTLKPEVVAGLDIVIVRELTGDIYFGEPRGQRTNATGEREGFDTMRYSVPEIERIARVGFETASRRGKKLCSVDKANVLDTSILWREVVTSVAKGYPEVALTHMYVDNAAMQLVRAPKSFDVIVTGNLFGDILSDEASMLAGSIGMLPSASLDASAKGLYEPIHGSAPDIAGQDKANPLATILSLAMMFRYTFARAELADRIEAAVRRVLQQGLRTADIAAQGERVIGTRAMGDAVVAALAAS